MSAGGRPGDPAISVLLCAGGLGVAGLGAAGLGGPGLEENLGNAIEACLGQSLFPESYEIVVVGPPRAEEITARYPAMNLRHVPVAAAENLRHRAAQAARGEFIAFLAMDALPDPSWLEKLLAAFHTRSPPPVCVAGRVELAWEDGPPGWYLPAYDHLLGAVDHGDFGFYPPPNSDRIQFDPANLAFQRHVFLEVGGFPKKAGPNPFEAMGEEKTLVNLLQARNQPVYYEPSARVRKRLSRKAVRRTRVAARARVHGACQPLLALSDPEFCRVHPLKRATADLLKATGHGWRGLIQSLSGQAAPAFQSILKGAQRLGRVQTLCRFTWRPAYIALWRNRWHRFESGESGKEEKGKVLQAFGIAARKLDSPAEAKGLTYDTADGGFPPTPLIFAENPFNDAVRRAQSILEIGCGVGRNLPWIMEHTRARYVGLDPNADMLRYFWQVNDAAQYRDRVLLVSDFEGLGDVRFDLVLSTFVFQHITYRPRPPAMNVEDITRAAMNHCVEDCLWFLLEHDREEPGWIERWISGLDIEPDVYLRNWRAFDFLRERGEHHLIIFKAPRGKS